MVNTLVEKASGETCSIIAQGVVNGYYTMEGKMSIFVWDHFFPFHLSNFRGEIPMGSVKKGVRSILLFGLGRDDIKGFISYRELPKEEIFTFVCDGTYEFRDVQ